MFYWITQSYAENAYLENYNHTHRIHFIHIFMCHFIEQTDFNSESTGSIESTTLPTTFSNLSIIQRSELLVTIFQSLFFETPGVSNEEKSVLFRNIIILDHKLTSNTLDHESIDHLYRTYINILCSSE